MTTTDETAEPAIEFTNNADGVFSGDPVSVSVGGDADGVFSGDPVSVSVGGEAGELLATITAKEVRDLFADLAEMREQLAEVHAFAKAAAELVDQFAPVAAALAEGGPMALLGALRQGQG